MHFLTLKCLLVGVAWDYYDGNQDQVGFVLNLLINESYYTLHIRNQRYGY